MSHSVTHNHTPNTNNKPLTGRPANPELAPIKSATQSWTWVYRQFLDIADRILESPEGQDHDVAHQLIAEEVSFLMAQHKGEWAWEFAYARWNEPVDEE